MDQIEMMRAFIAVAETNGFAAAARLLGISPPALTRAVAALEKRLDARLLNRTTRQVRLTEAGQRFLVDAKRILTDLDEATALARGDHIEPQGLLAVTAPVMFGRMHIAPLLFDYGEQFPRISIRAMFLDRVVNLMDEGYDVALRVGTLQDSSLTAVKVGTVRRVIVASPSYLAARGIPQSPADLAEHDAINSSRTPWRFAGSTIAEPHISLSVNGSDVAIAFALAGKGLARPFSYQVDDEIRAGRLQLVLREYEPPPIPVQLVHFEGRQAAAKVRSFVDFAAARLRALPGLKN